MLQHAIDAARILRDKGLQPTVINPRILSSVDETCLDTLTDYRKVITVDDGILDGGFGQKVAAYLSPKGVTVHCLGLKKEFMDRYNVKAILQDNGMTPEAIAALALPA